jgi:precorrin-3B methylase
MAALSLKAILKDVVGLQLQCDDLLDLIVNYAASFGSTLKEGDRVDVSLGDKWFVGEVIRIQAIQGEQKHVLVHFYNCKYPSTAYYSDWIPSDSTRIAPLFSKVRSPKKSEITVLTDTLKCSQDDAQEALIKSGGDLWKAINSFFRSLKKPT